MTTARRTLAGSTVLAAIAAITTLLLVAGIAPAGAADGNGPSVERRSDFSLYADLSITAESLPEPVNAGNNVLFRHTVTNDGPDAAEGTLASGFPDASGDEDIFLTDVSLEFPFNGDRRAQRRGEEFDPCSIGEGSLSWSCDIGFLADGETVIVNVVGITPEVTETTLFPENSAEVTSDAIDQNPSDNSVNFSTTVIPEDPNSDAGFIPPEGGELTTDPGTGATEEDNTVITLRVPGGGPGGPASVNEEECDALDALQPCIGNIGNFVPPEGYDRLVAEFVYDRSITRGGLKNNRRRNAWEVRYQKAEGDDVQLLPYCDTNGNVVPCVLGTRRLDVGDPLSDAHRDLRVRVAIDSDPRLATRK
ncbi:MAG: hypothetical protein WD739_06480 [Actinomycetota bacterium]